MADQSSPIKVPVTYIRSPTSLSSVFSVYGPMKRRTFRLRGNGIRIPVTSMAF